MKVLIVLSASITIIGLIGVIIFKRFKKKVNDSLLPFAGSLGLFYSLFKYASEEKEEQPRSLGGLDSIYLSKIKKDFPNLNINELREEAKKVILKTFEAIENKDTEMYKESENINYFIRNSIKNYKNSDVHFYSINIHDTVISKYENFSGVSTLCFKSSVGYDSDIDGLDKTHYETIIEVEFIYIVDESKVSKERKALGLNCPNCGAPIKGVGEKTCNHCGSGLEEISKRVWIVNNLVKY